MSRLLRKYRKAALAIICALCTFIVLLLYVLSVFEFGLNLGYFQIGSHNIPWVKELLHLEYETMDLRAEYGRKSPKSDEFVYLAIDEPSINLGVVWPEEIEASPTLQLMKEGWPFNRGVYADAIERAIQAGARVVILDLILTGPRDGDERLQEVMDKYKDQVLIGANYVPKQGTAGAGFGGVQEILQLPSPTIIAHPESQTEPVETETPAESDSAESQNLRNEPLYETDPRIGFVNFIPESDQVIRTALFYKQAVEGHPIVPSLAARTMEMTGRGHLVPEDTLNRLTFFRYTGHQFSADYPGDGFEPRSLYGMFVPSIWEANFDDGEVLRDKIVLIGPDGNFLQDEHLTPFGLMRGPEIHLNAMNALLQQDFLEESDFWTDLALIIGAGFLAWVFLVIFRSPVMTSVMIVTANVGYLAAALYLYNEWALYLLVVPPLLAFDLSAIVGSLTEFISERIEKRRTRATLERYVAKNIVKDVLDNPDSFYNKMGGERLPVTVLFSDVRGFTTYTEKADSHEVVDRLNVYLTEMGDAVLATNGTLDKFIGDAVMAVWGNFKSEGVHDDARRAVETAVSMRRKLEALNAGWKEEGYDPWAFGIGIHQGDAIVGSLGSDKIKQDPTVIGDTVNTGARLESYTKQYGLDLLVSEAIVPHIQDDYHLRSVDKVVFKGKTLALEIFTVVEHKLVPLDEERQRMLALYEEGLKLLRPPVRDFPAALEKFRAAAELAPEDSLCQMYIERAEYFIENPPPEDWQGEQVATSK